MRIKKILAVVTAVAAASMSLCTVGCSEETENATPTNTDEYIIPQDYCRTYYEVFVRSFADSNGDGIGDLRGLANNLDYLNDGDDRTTADLGINGIWMMPINMSPSYHKYDVSDYYAIDDEYGTLDDFDYLVSECNKRDIWLQMDLVLNHTSTEHDWFKAAIKEAQDGKDPSEPDDSPAMSRYEFTKRAAAPAGKGWWAVPGASQYYYRGYFAESMPEVNLANDEVREEIENIVDFWLGKGIRSFRLDAVPWACADNTTWNEANGEFWTWFNDYCNQKGEEIFGEEGDGINVYCYNVGEVWAGSSTIKSFFGTKMSNFNFAFAEKSNSGFAGAANEYKVAASVIESLEKLQKEVLEIDPNALLSNFLTNHDIDRSAEKLFADTTNIKEGAALYLLAPGNPYIYYGEEIGALGSGRDENKRLAFNWGDSRKVSDPPNSDYEGKQEYGSVKSQTTDAGSILTYYRNAIKIRNRFPEIGRGLMTSYALNANGKLTKISDIRGADGDYISLRAVNLLNDSIAAYTLTWNDRDVFIVHNVGEKAANIDASDFADRKVVATLKSGGGTVSFKDGVLKMSGGTVAVLKVPAEA